MARKLKKQKAVYKPNKNLKNIFLIIVIILAVVFVLYMVFYPSVGRTNSEGERGNSLLKNLNLFASYVAIDATEICTVKNNNPEVQLVEVIGCAEKTDHSVVTCGSICNCNVDFKKEFICSEGYSPINPGYISNLCNNYLKKSITNHIKKYKTTNKIRCESLIAINPLGEVVVANNNLCYKKFDEFQELCDAYCNDNYNIGKKFEGTIEKACIKN